ncbi:MULTISPECIES: XRE family transcriptional regulator [Enterobacter cloacae complex]|uniref:XRE family transcriptional regulator n=1 Tax=Enterobacter cloacae complex TaxID=354276 RepID=UPI0014954C85|nr:MULTISPECIES: helix-turn-helix transcriptional regulator [Enterobacter cloacae complex]HCM9431154.1 helix-turn-helix transcriptional regulator [Enterobacter hormaechei subsp. steigerwaltii]HDC4615874.1 helix-turn-helix transcriptional regulator [Enterobacter cloacae]MDQ6590063.1 helix-turn-helix transcriptional regulator [Enterobacter hormaechei]MEB7605320.1 helix-turn-helix transcriptional regulator [Enterobacter kobei]HDT4235111.1 helix-turn-helix transcriptional regulator [Enterobacter h
MKTTLAGRLKEARAARGLTQKALGDLVGVSQAAIQKIETGKASHTTKLVEIANALGVMPDWLSSGEGVMLNDGKPGAALLTNAISDVFRVDVLDLTVSAGPGSFMISEFVEVLHAIEFTNEHARSLFGNRAQHDVKVMTVDGDSMCPTIQSGDRLFFDVSVRNFKVDGVYAFVFGQHFHVKRLQMQGLQLAVLSDNPAYKDWYVTEENQDQLYIMGKALIHESIAYNKL